VAQHGVVGIISGVDGISSSRSSIIVIYLSYMANMQFSSSMNPILEKKKGSSCWD
jgi:hypothetical protein